MPEISHIPEFLNMRLYDWEDFWYVVIRFIFNLGVVLYLVRLNYY